MRVVCAPPSTNAGSPVRVSRFTTAGPTVTAFVSVSDPSAAVTVCAPAVRKVTPPANVWVPASPAVNGYDGGLNDAAPSDVVNDTVPRYPVATLRKRSLRVTVRSAGTPAVSLPDGGTATASVRVAAWSATTVTPGDVTDRLFVASAARTVHVPALRSSAEKFPTPFGSGPPSGTTPSGSVVLSPTAPAYAVSTLLNRSRAVTVNGRTVPATVFAGRPVMARWLADAGVTVIPVSDPATGPLTVAAVAVIRAVGSPPVAVVSVTPLVNVWVPASPAVNGYGAGSTVCGFASLLVNVTVPV